MSEQEMQSAIAIIKDEHCSLASVIKGMQYLLEQGQRSGQPPEFRALRAALYYIETFTEALHHPKEEAYLFRLLRSRTSEFDKELDRLEREHVEEEQTYYELSRALRRYQACTADGPDAFAHTLTRFAEDAWRHMRFEEEVILPAAARHLTAEDWQEVTQAFCNNGDPRFGRVPDQQFRKLFAHIQSLMPDGVDS
jgi:hemerythrin-like domain-containing protein